MPVRSVRPGTIGAAHKGARGPNIGPSGGQDTHTHTDPMPQGTRRLLGLGLKFCTLRARPTNRINKTIERAKTDIRRMAYFRENPPEKREGVHYIPQLYIKNTAWAKTLRASKEIEKEPNEFESKLRQVWKGYQKSCPSPT